ncbi:hypothetical protein FACS1894153_1260 [Bacteroidia bacterium]|nr:hypothetical protein FACS1894153_1260 [Bacteroidia bacterium]
MIKILKRIINISVICSILFIITGCPFAMDYKYQWCVHNKTSDTLGVYMAFGIYEFSPTSYPDTTLPVYLDKNMIFMSEPNTERTIFGTGIRWDKIIIELPKDTLSIFVFNYDTLKNYTWEEINENYKILVRYDLSYNDLNMLKFTIHYPPTIEMKNMKMYPPYKESE